MARKYNSTRRRQAAEQTRKDIVEAALKLHWEGISELEPLAQAAGVSLPTVRSHFPTKEAVFQACTRTFAERVDFPDLDALGAMTDPEARLEACVAESCRLHEMMFGYAWLSAYQRKDSPNLDAVMETYEGLTGAIAELVAPAGSPPAGVVRSLLDFLTYRAFRRSGDLSPEDTRQHLTTAIRRLVPDPR